MWQILITSHPFLISNLQSQFQDSSSEPTHLHLNFCTFTRGTVRSFLSAYEGRNICVKHKELNNFEVFGNQMKLLWSVWYSYSRPWIILGERLPNLMIIKITFPNLPHCSDFSFVFSSWNLNKFKKWQFKILCPWSFELQRGSTFGDKDLVHFFNDFRQWFFFSTMDASDGETTGMSTSSAGESRSYWQRSRCFFESQIYRGV